MELFGDYGVTPEGFKRPRLPEIQAILLNRYADELNITITTRPDSVVGILFGIMSYGYSDLFEFAEQQYYAMYPNSAEGVNLDNAVVYTGVSRQGYTQTRVAISCTGAQNTIIPADSMIRDFDNISYINPAAGIITLDNATTVTTNLASVTAGQVISITINNKTYNYTVSADDQPDMVLFSLAEQINASATGWSAQNQAVTLALYKENKEQGEPVALSSHFLGTIISSPVWFTCETYGAINPAINSIQRIISIIDGWTGASNQVPAIVGFSKETDVELRQTYDRRVYRTGSASVDSIAARLIEEIENVVTANVFENDSDFEDEDGRPPHSIEAVVEGGADVDIAQKIFEVKSGGIDTFGETMATVKDSMNISHDIYFNRPLPQIIWVKVAIQRSPEESLPGNIANVVAEIITETGNQMGIGTDVVWQRLIGAIYRGTTGIWHIDITGCISETEPDASEYSPENIPLSVRQVAIYDPVRIEVTILD